MPWLRLIDTSNREIVVNMDHVIKVEPRQVADRRVGSKLTTSTVNPEGKLLEIEVADHPEKIASALSAQGEESSC
jgi:hypothetical protein